MHIVQSVLETDVGMYRLKCKIHFGAIKSFSRIMQLSLPLCVTDIIPVSSQKNWVKSPFLFFEYVNEQILIMEPRSILFLWIQIKRVSPNNY